MDFEEMKKHFPRGSHQLHGGQVVASAQWIVDFGNAMYAKGAGDMRERADDAWADALQSDCEQGVKWLSENTAYTLRAKYPALAKLGETIRALPITPTNTEG